MTKQLSAYELERLEEKRQERISMMKFIAGCVLAGSMVIGAIHTFAAFDQIDQGNFGIGKSWSGQYQEQVIEEGFSYNPFTKVIKVDGRNNLVQIQDIRPKDSNGILLEDLDLSMTYNVNPNGAIEFIQKYRDLSPGYTSEYFALGAGNIQKTAKRVAMEVIGDFASEDLLNSPQPAEDALKEAVQTRLDEQFGAGLFQVEGFTMSNVKVSDLVEQQIQSIAAQKASAYMAQAQLDSLAQRKQAEMAEAQSIVDVSKTTGMTVQEILEVRRLALLREMKTTGVVASVSVDSPSTGQPKP